MTTLFDNLSALIIAGAVLLVMVTMQRQAQQAAVERAVSYMSTRQAIEFGRWVQDDLANIGAGVAVGQQRLSAPTDNADGLTTNFSFQRRLQAGGGNPQQITYRLQFADTIRVRRDGEERTVKLYRLQRDGGSGGEDVSAPTVTDFKVELLDVEGNETHNPGLARYVRVRFSTASRFLEDNRYLHENHWATTIPLRS